jgi:hypothetical protein
MASMIPIGQMQLSSGDVPETCDLAKIDKRVRFPFAGPVPLQADTHDYAAQMPSKTKGRVAVLSRQRKQGPSPAGGAKGGDHH